MVMLALVHISADMKHDSFLAQSIMNLTFKYLVQAGIPLQQVIQFCDNCAAQYKSRRPFVEITRCALDLIRVYFGEKHGKSHADALFGRLKAWMTFKIKAQHFVVKSAFDFYRFCREFYQTNIRPGCCQHYRVEFEFVRPCDVRRHQDSDLDKAVEHTHKIYSVRNTPEPLQLKVRSVPCLCPPCVSQIGTCLNSTHTDPWKLVKLIPVKGSTLNKYKKRQRPDHDINHEENTEQVAGKQSSTVQDDFSYSEQDNSDRESVDEENDEITFVEDEIVLPVDNGHESSAKVKNKHNLREKEEGRGQENKCDDVTDSVTDNTELCTEDKMKMPPTWVNVSEEINADDFISSSESQNKSTCNSSDIEVIEICEKSSKEFQLAAENILPQAQTSRNISVTDIFEQNLPESVVWTSILSALESARTFDDLRTLCTEVSECMPTLKQRVKALCMSSDKIDLVAQAEIPPDGPVHLKALKTGSDGNCLCRALVHGYFNDESCHIELRVCIVVEGVL